MQRLINTSLMLVLFGLVILWAGCGGPKTEPILLSAPVGETTTPETTAPSRVGDIEVPEWFLNIPQDPNYLYSAATDSSKDMQHALENAREAGRTDISGQIETKVAAMFKRFTEEVGIGEDSEMLAMTTAVTKSVTADVVKMSKVLKQDVKPESANVYRAYVLLELNIGEMNSGALAKIKDNENLYTRFRASEGFKELEAEVEKYEQWKKEQAEG
jgi:hypothetical protein